MDPETGGNDDEDTSQDNEGHTEKVLDGEWTSGGQLGQLLYRLNTDVVFILPF